MCPVSLLNFSNVACSILYAVSWLLPSVCRMLECGPGSSFTLPWPDSLNLGPPRGGTRIHQNFSLSPRSPKITDLLPQAPGKLLKRRLKVVLRTPKYQIIKKCGTLRKHPYLQCFFDYLVFWGPEDDFWTSFWQLSRCLGKQLRGFWGSRWQA